MDKENMVHIHDGVFFSSEERCDHFLYRKMDGTSEPHVEQDKPHSELQISHFHSHAEFR
jgi:hypothetical protein